MSVFTVLNCGTGYNRTVEGELVANLARNMKGQEARIDKPDSSGNVVGEYLVNDGVGSGKGGTKNPQPGRFNPFTNGKKSGLVSTLNKVISETFRGKSGFRRHFYGDTGADPFQSDTVTQALGGATGHGWDDNVVKTMYALAALPELPAVVNMVGWSRGAITCIKTAYKMWEVLGDEVRVNIFAVDPVPGPWHMHEASIRTLYGNVDNFVAILAMDEHRRFFHPVWEAKLDQSKCNGQVLFLPMPGKHCGQVEVVAWGFESPARLTESLAWKFLKYYGTPFSSDFNPNMIPRDICARYADMVLHMADYKRYLENKGFSDSMMGGIGTRTFTKESEMSKRVGTYFINEHHRATFEECYRSIYEVIFTNSVPRHAVNVTRLQQETAELARSNRIVYDSLRPYFAWFQNAMFLPNPGSGAAVQLATQTNRWPARWPK